MTRSSSTTSLVIEVNTRQNLNQSNLASHEGVCSRDTTIVGDSREKGKGGEKGRLTRLQRSDARGQDNHDKGVAGDEGSTRQRAQDGGVLAWRGGGGGVGKEGREGEMEGGGGVQRWGKVVRR